MRMVMRRRRTDAHEFPGANLDHRHARIVMKVGDDVFRHGKSFAAAPRRRIFRGTIARRVRDA